MSKVISSSTRSNKGVTNAQSFGYDSDSWPPRQDSYSTTDQLRKSGPWAREEPPQPPAPPCENSTASSSSAPIVHVPPSTTIDEDVQPPLYDQYPRRSPRPVALSVASDSTDFDLWDKIVRPPSQETSKTSGVHRSTPAPVSCTSVDTKDHTPRQGWPDHVFTRVPSRQKYLNLVSDLIEEKEKELDECLQSDVNKSLTGVSTGPVSRSRKTKTRDTKNVTFRKRRHRGKGKHSDLEELENKCLELMEDEKEEEESTTETPVSVDLRPFLKKKRTRKPRKIVPVEFDFSKLDENRKTHCCSPVEESAFSIPDIPYSIKTEVQPEIEVKPTLASTLREAATFAKDAAKEEELLVHLLSKSTTVGEYEDYLMKMRDRMEEERLIELQRKRIEGLISFEEAVKAKIRVISENVAKGRLYLEEKRHLLEKLNRIYEEIDRKNKAKISDVKEQYKKRENNVFQSFMEKQFIGAAVLYEKQQIMKTREEEESKELERKITLIKEFKILQTIRKEQIKEAKHEKLKYLRQLSADEIQARLIIFKRKFKEELLAKQQAVDDFRTRTAALKTAVAEMVEEQRKKKTLRKFEKEEREIELTPSHVSLSKLKGGKNLLELHKKLMDLKKARLASKQK